MNTIKENLPKSKHPETYLYQTIIWKKNIKTMFLTINVHSIKERHLLMLKVYQTPRTPND